MKISYENNRIRRKCEKASGKLKRRLDDISAVNHFEDLSTLPGGCHKLTGDRAGQWAMYLDEPCRLIFKPAKEDPITIIIIAVEDYHGGRKKDRK